MSDFKDRLLIELDALVDKVNKLSDFLDTDSFSKLSERQRVLLCRQYKHMSRYLETLNQRAEDLATTIIL
jgi:hypothetical protein